MTRLTTTSLIAIMCTILITTGVLSAHAAKLRNDPNRPTDKISADLGVTEEQFIACFWNVNPEENGRPSGAKQRENKAILLPCLQEANASITNDKLDSVMDKYRPEGPMN
ncbi:MAG: hypothetical protein AAGF25_00325 [Pseudomonadota bacterium]